MVGLLVQYPTIIEGFPEDTRHNGKITILYWLQQLAMFMANKRREEHMI